GPARATVITYVNPAVAVLLGVLLLGEHFTVGMAVGFPLILAGSVLAARRGGARGGTVRPRPRLGRSGACRSGFSRCGRGPSRYGTTRRPGRYRPLTAPATRR